MHSARLGIAALWAVVPLLLAQENAPKSLNLVIPSSRGTVKVPLGAGWSPTGLFLYDQGTRPVVQLKDTHTGVTVSYILFPNNSGTPTAEGCREDAINPVLRNLQGSMAVTATKRDIFVSSAGDHLATISYQIAPSGKAATIADVPLQQQNTFAFYGTKDLCAEVHVSIMGKKGSEQQEMESLLKGLTVDPAHTATATELASLGSILYRTMHDYKGAAIYYERALAVLLPAKNSSEVDFSRFITDQLSMSYGLSGDLKRSRAINEAAITKDPDYPLYYYNLACADAEENNASAAQKHLQQAFDRRANTLKGETLPDPSTDDSFLKLKKNKQFWAFVESLPKG